MIAIAILLGSLWLAALVLVALWVAMAPIGYEDAGGFHYGPEPRSPIGEFCEFCERLG